MATSMNFLVNAVNADHDYGNYASDYIAVILDDDYLIWTAGNTIVKDLMEHEPDAPELNEAASIIDDTDPVTVALCLLMDLSHNWGGDYYTHKVIGMGENKRYVFCFSFDGATATEPQLEAWDSATHTTYAKYVLGNGTPANSMVKGVCTTSILPGASWAGAPLAGASNVLLLNDGNGALSAPESGETADVYANLKIVIPGGYATPSAETFTITIRHTYA